MTWCNYYADVNFQITSHPKVFNFTYNIVTMNSRIWLLRRCGLNAHFKNSHSWSWYQNTRKAFGPEHCPVSENLCNL